MRELKSASRYEVGESLGFSIVMICFGLTFLAMGLSSMTSPWGLLRGGTGYFAYAPLLFLLFGLMVAGGGVHQVRLSRKFGKPQAIVFEDVTRPGETFHFRYEQQCRQLTAIESIGVFLVFRERVSYSDVSDTTTTDIDRLIQQFKHKGRVYSVGETIREEHAFQIPSRVMGIKNAYMDRKDATMQTMWVIKVHLDFGKANEIWKEYQVPVERGYVLMLSYAIAVATAIACKRRKRPGWRLD
jgi:hypothetical protein